MRLLRITRRLPGKHSETRSNEWDSNKWVNSKFDETTGQIYTEETASILSADDQNWTRQSHVESDYRDYYRGYADEWTSPFRGEESREIQHGHVGEVKSSRVGLRGAGPLQDHAIDCIVQNISAITLELVQFLPTSLLLRIWHGVVERNLLTFNTWMIFSKLLHKDGAPSFSLLRYRHEIKTPRSPLHVYANPLVSPSFDFITSLSITTPFPFSDLVRLSRITNLGVLEIINTAAPRTIDSASESFHQGVGDRLIRAWHLAAVNDGAFKALRVLKLWNHEDLTSKSLVYLNSFPALGVYDVKNCAFDGSAKVHARQLGWKPTLEQNILGLTEAVCRERVALLHDPLGAGSKPLRRASYGDLGDVKVRKIPRSEARKFLCQREDLELKAELERSAQEQPKVAILDSKELIRVISRESKTRDSRDTETNTIYARIGELRNDSDLAAAGISIGDQIVLGDELANSLPMVSLYLGQLDRSWQPVAGYAAYSAFTKRTDPETAPSDDNRLEYKPAGWGSGSGPRSLCFIRVKVPPKDTTTVSQTGTTAAAHTYPLTGATNAVDLKEGAPAKRQGAGVMWKRKRRLNDVLSSFT